MKLRLLKDARLCQISLATSLILIFWPPALAQTSSDQSYTITERGASYRVWQRSVPITNALTGQVSQEVQGYTELGDGMHYQTADGSWVESQDMIAVTPDGAQAIQGSMKACFSADITSIGAITLTTTAGELFQSRPIGLFYADPTSGKIARIATAQPCQGTLYPPNVVVFSNALSGLSADLMLVWAKNGFEQNLVIKQRPPSPESFGLSSSTARLQLWSAMDSCPTPRQQRSVQLESGLTDHILVFDGCWFPVGSAFAFGAATPPPYGEPARIRLISPADPKAVPVAKSLTTILGQTVLIEEIKLSDLSPLLSALPLSALQNGSPKTANLTERGKLLPSSNTIRLQSRPMQVATGRYTPTGLVLDYIQLAGDTHSYTFASNTTYLITSTFTVGPDGTTFQPNVCVKNTGGYLLLYGTLSFPAGLPVVFTSKDDNRYGQRITNSTANPGYVADPAVWMYYEDVHTTVQNAIFRWARTAIKYDENTGALVSPSISSSCLQNCQYGLSLNIQDDTLSLSGVTSCNVGTPVSISSGSVSGSMTDDCGVASVAMVNDPNRDLSGLDTNKSSQTECSFALLDGTNVVAAFMDTHLSEYGLAFGGTYFPGIPSPRTTSWAVSTNSGASFIDKGPLLPLSTITNGTTVITNGASDPMHGDAGDTTMAYDSMSNVVYLLVNTSREQTNYYGFRLWASRDKGLTFIPVNMDVPGTDMSGNHLVSSSDKPMVKAASTNLYVAGHGVVSNATGVWAARSTNQGTNWNLFQQLEAQPSGGTSSGADIVTVPDGTVYFFWLQTSGKTNQFRYAWLSTNNVWSYATNIGPRLNSTNNIGSGDPLRANGVDSRDHFENNAFPRAAYANGNIYIAYADMPSTNNGTTDKGDIFLLEASVNWGGHWLSLSSGPRRVNNDGTQTDQWNPSIAVDPMGTQLFIGYYSRQNDPTTNSRIMAYGAKAIITNGLALATFDCIPVSPSSFLPMFAGTNVANNTWSFDPVWPQACICLDTNAAYAGVGCDFLACPSWPGSLGAPSTTDTYANFCADDYTWSCSDSNYFYFAWCDRSRTFGTAPNVRPDADIKFAKIKQ